MDITVATDPLDKSLALETIYRKVSRRLVAPLLLAYIVAYLDRVNVGFAKLQMLRDLHFSETVYGLGAGIFFIGYFLFGVPSNLALRRTGARTWLATLMVVWGLTSAATVLVKTPGTFYMVRFLLGATEAGFFPGVIFYFTQWYPSCRRSKVTAIFMTGIAICGAIGNMVSGWIIQALSGQGGWAGWQWLFVLEAIPALLVGLSLLICLTDHVSDAMWLSPDEQVLLAADLKQEVGAKPTGSLVAALRDGRVWVACAIYFCATSGLYGVSFWLPSIVSELGFQRPLDIGLLAAIPYAAAAVGMVLVGRSADRRGEQRWHMAVSAAVGALGLILSALLSGHAAWAIAALTLAAVGILTTPPLFWSLPTKYLSGTAAAGGIAFINSFGCLSGFVSPYVVGRITDMTGSIHASMYMVAATVFIGAVLIVVTVPRRAGAAPQSNAVVIALEDS